MIILIALVTLCLAVSAVSAWEFSFGSQSSSSSSVSTDGDVATVDYKDGSLKISGMEFKIPSGYEQNTNETRTGADTNLTGVDGAKLSSATFTNGNKTIIVKCVYANDGKIDKYTPATSNAQNQTINNHAGFLEKHPDGSITYTYIDDGKIIQIESPDEATINEILK